MAVELLAPASRYQDMATELSPEGAPIRFSRHEGGKRFVFSIDPVFGSKFTVYESKVGEDGVGHITPREMEVVEASEFLGKSWNELGKRIKSNDLWQKARKRHDEMQIKATREYHTNKSPLPHNGG